MHSSDKSDKMTSDKSLTAIISGLLYHSPALLFFIVLVFVFNLIHVSHYRRHYIFPSVPNTFVGFCKNINLIELVILLQSPEDFTCSVHTIEI